MTARFGLSAARPQLRGHPDADDVGVDYQEWTNCHGTCSDSSSQWAPNLLIYILFSKPEEMTPHPASEFSMS